MAGPNIFVVYDDTTKQIIHEPTLNLAAAQALAGSGQTAHTDGLNEAQNDAGDTVDAGISVDSRGSWYFYDTAPNLRQRRFDPTPIRTAVSRWHHRHEELSALLNQDELHAWYPERDIELGKNIIHYICAGTYMMWFWHQDGQITQAQFLQWLRNSALGPADGPRAHFVFVSPDAAGSTLTFTYPTTLGWGSDGNGWDIIVRNTTGSDNRATLDRSARTTTLRLADGTTLAEVRTLLATIDVFAETDSVIAGDASHTFPIPATTATLPTHNMLAGGSFLYDRNDEETFFEIASMIPANSPLRNVSEGLSLVDTAPPFGRRTIAGMLENHLGTSTFSSRNIRTPTVTQLDRGRWIERITV